MFVSDRAIASPGELAKKVWDAQVSATIAHNDTDTLVAASQFLASPGQPVPQAWWLTRGRNLRRMWDRAELHRLKQSLKQDGRLEDYRYQAYTWAMGPDGVPVRVPAKFVAKLIEVVTLYGDDYRLVYASQIDD